MLINVFGRWVNPNNITYLSPEYNIHTQRWDTNIHTIGGQSVWVNGESLDTVAAEINRQIKAAKEMV